MKTHKLLSVVLAALMLLALVPTMAYAAGAPVVEVNDIQKITVQNEGTNSVYTFPFDGVVIIKQGSNLWVWTAAELKAAEKEAMQNALENLIKDYTHVLYDKGAIKGFVYGSSFEITKSNGDKLNLTLDSKNQLIAGKDDLSMLFAGSYSITYPEQYEWVLQSQKEDSCTGFISLDDSLIGNSWFRMQKITLPVEGQSVSIGINSGNPKNGATIVGSIMIRQQQIRCNV